MYANQGTHSGWTPSLVPVFLLYLLLSTLIMKELQHKQETWLLMEALKSVRYCKTQSYVRSTV